jgi:hypothetical protein
MEQKPFWRAWTGLIWLRTGTTDGLLWRRWWNFGLKRGEFLVLMRNYSILKKDSAFCGRQLKRNVLYVFAWTARPCCSLSSHMRKVQIIWAKWLLGAVLENVPVTPLLNAFSAFYRTRKSICLFTRSEFYFFENCFKWRLLLGPWDGVFCLSLPAEILKPFVLSPCFCPSHLFSFEHSLLYVFHSELLWGWATIRG